MRIYFGLQEDKAAIQELEKDSCSEIVLLPGSLQQFLAAVPAEAIYLPFSMTEQWKAIPTVHTSQVLDVPENQQQKFFGASFILTGAALKESDPRTAEYEAEVLFNCLLEAMKKKKIGSLAVWGGFFSDRLNYRLCIQKLQSAVAKTKNPYRVLSPSEDANTNRPTDRASAIAQVRKLIKDYKLSPIEVSARSRPRSWRVIKKQKNASTRQSETTSQTVSQEISAYKVTRARTKEALKKHELE